MTRSTHDRHDGDDKAFDREARAEEDVLDPEPLDPEKPAAGVDDVIEVFDREPPERPVSDAEGQPPFG